MSDNDNSTEATAQAQVQPAAMNGFTIQQIISWTNAEIEKCREKLEIEPSGRVVAYLQGKIPGCKFAIRHIREIFGLLDESFDNINLEKPADMGNMTMEQILGAEIDMNELRDKNELWGRFLNVVNTRAEEIKEILLKKAKKSRELDEYQGEYQGMMTFEKVFTAIQDQVFFWKNSLFKKGDGVVCEEGDEMEMRDANEFPALPPPDDENEPPAEDYEDTGDRDTDSLPDEDEDDDTTGNGDGDDEE